MDEERKPKIMNLHELTPTHTRSHGTKYEARHAIVGSTLGAKKLGYNLTELSPGKTAFLFRHRR